MGYRRRLPPADLNVGMYGYTMQCSIQWQTRTHEVWVQIHAQPWKLTGGLVKPLLIEISYTETLLGSVQVDSDLISITHTDMWWERQSHTYLSPKLTWILKVIFNTFAFTRGNWEVSPCFQNQWHKGSKQCSCQQCSYCTQH